MKKIIKHFRKNWIRHGFETLVVMIGILGAFTLNNWNENRKDNRRERQLLRELVVNLNSNIQAFNQNTTNQLDAVKSIDIILDHLENKKPYQDSLANLFRTLIYLEQINISSSSYETLKSNGFDIIRSDELRMEIIQLFEMTYPVSIKLVRDVAMQRYSVKQSILDKYFRTNRERTKAVPVDYKALQEDDAFINFVYATRAWKMATVDQNQRMIEPTSTLLESVNEYLND